MVYSVRSNRSIVSVKKLSNTHVQSERAKSIDSLMKNSRVSVQTDPSGRIRVNTTKD